MDPTSPAACLGDDDRPLAVEGHAAAMLARCAALLLEAQRHTQPGAAELLGDVLSTHETTVEVTFTPGASARVRIVALRPDGGEVLIRGMTVVAAPEGQR
jgi:hypothetical protein